MKTTLKKLKDILSSIEDDRLVGLITINKNDLIKLGVDCDISSAIEKRKYQYELLKDGVSQGTFDTSIPIEELTGMDRSYVRIIAKTGHITKNGFSVKATKMQ